MSTTNRRHEVFVPVEQFLPKAGRGVIFLFSDEVNSGNEYNSPSQRISLAIIKTEDFCDGYVPPASLSLCSEEDIIALRDWLTAQLDESKVRRAEWKVPR